MVKLLSIELPLLAIWLISGIALAVLGLWMASSRLRRAAIVTYAGGLCVLSGSIFYLSPALIRADITRDVDDLQNQLLSLKGELAREREKGAKLQAKLASKERGSESLLQQSSALQQRSDELLSTLEIERRKIASCKVAIWKAQRSNLRLRAARDTLRAAYKELSLVYENGRSAQPDDGNPGHGKEEQLQQECSLPKLADAAAKDDRFALWLETDADHPDFAIRRLEPGLIADKPGNYYHILFKKPDGSAFIFPAAKYELSLEDAASFKAATQKLAEEIKARGASGAGLESFIRGAADRGGRRTSLPFKSEEFKSVEFLPLMQAGSDKYQQQPKTKEFGATYKNDDLPNLRAAFGRNLMGNLLPGKPPLLLEGTVSQKLNEQDRTVELFLFVPQNR